MCITKSESAGVAQRQIREESVEVESISEKSDLGNDEVRCFCNDKREIGEMVQCEMCVGWFHLECLRMKEGVGVLDGKTFVCCFCLSAKVLELTRLVGELRGEMTELRESADRVLSRNEFFGGEDGKGEVRPW